MRSRRLLDGLSKVLKEKKIALTFLVKIYPQNMKTNVFIFCLRNLTSGNVPQKYTRKRTKYICKVFIAVLLKFVVAKDLEQSTCPLIGS